MTQEDKQLLLKDLCGRLQYGVVLRVNNRVIDRLVSILNYKNTSDWFVNGFNIDFVDIKPYLRPMSSMTDEEREELSCYENGIQRADFYYSHHIDCRFMIEKGLALEAPEGMYKSE